MVVHRINILSDNFSPFWLPGVDILKQKPSTLSQTIAVISGRPSINKIEHGFWNSENQMQAFCHNTNQKGCDKISFILFGE